MKYTKRYLAETMLVHPIVIVIVVKKHNHVHWAERTETDGGAYKKNGYSSRYITTKIIKFSEDHLEELS